LYGSHAGRFKSGFEVKSRLRQKVISYLNCGMMEGERERAVKCTSGENWGSGKRERKSWWKWKANDLIKWLWHFNRHLGRAPGKGHCDAKPFPTSLACSRLQRSKVSQTALPPSALSRRLLRVRLKVVAELESTGLILDDCSLSLEFNVQCRRFVWIV